MYTACDILSRTGSKKFALPKTNLIETIDLLTESLSVWENVFVLLEQNQVGRALLQPPSLVVPLGPWPVVLAKAAGSMSVHAKNCDADEYNTNFPAFSGIFYMVKRLVESDKLESRDTIGGGIVHQSATATTATNQLPKNQNNGVCSVVTPQYKHRRLV